MLKTFCDACEQEIPNSHKRCEFAISWEVPISVQDRKAEYEICLHCSNEMRRLLGVKLLLLDKKAR